jgi:uncharacterized Rmd1/YagE family protein
MNFHVAGYHAGDRLNIKELKNNLPYHCIYADPNELIYQLGEFHFIHFFDYGSIVLFGKEDMDLLSIWQTIKKEIGSIDSVVKSESFDVEVNENAAYTVLFDRVVLPKIHGDLIKIISLNIAQSVALDFYTDQSNQLLEHTSRFSKELEDKGKFSLRGKKLLKFIGRTLNLKNRIVTNLYIFDSPYITWNDQMLNQLNNDLSRELDIKSRHSSIQNNLNTVKENLEIFNDIHQHMKSEVLELIIILLITFEIINVLLERIPSLNL